MDRIKQLLQEQGKQTTDDAIQAKLSEYGIPEGQITEADAKTIAQELEPSAQSISGLAVSNGSSAPTPAKKQPRGRKNAKQVALENAIKQAAKETESELGTFETNLNRHKGLYVSHRSDAIVAEIRNTSTEIVEAVTDKLVKEVADVDTFQQIGDEFGAGLFAFS